MQYLNCVIQQLYMIPQFRNSILDVDDKKEPEKSEVLNDDNILHQLQKLFTYLSYTSYGEVIPKDLVVSIKDSSGKPINQVLDSNEFYNNKKTCSSCKKVSYDNEPFKSITLDVENSHNLNESLDKYISEKSIKDYKCPICNETVILKKATYISRLPNILIIHLKL